MEPFDLKLWPGFEKALSYKLEKSTVDQIVIDSRRITSKNALFVALKGEKTDGHAFVEAAAAAGAKFALVEETFASENRKIHLLRVKSPLEGLQQIAGRYRKERRAPLLAI